MKRKITTVRPNSERIGRRIKKWFKKPGAYTGEAAIVASPGEILPRVQRDAKVKCKAIWASDVYFDENGRSRIDVAFGVAKGTVDGIVRLEAGGQRVPIYNFLGLEEVATGNQFFKNIEIRLGANNQEQSSIIKSWEGDADTPTWPGLAYFVLKGFKLWKWPNKAVPHLEAVILRNVAAFDSRPDTYPPGGSFLTSTNYNTASAIWFDGHIYIMHTGGSLNKQIFRYDVDLDTYTTEYTFADSTTIRGQDNAFAISRGVLFCTNGRDVVRRDGVGSWTDIGFAAGQIDGIGGNSVGVYLINSVRRLYLNATHASGGWSFLDQAAKRAGCIYVDEDLVLCPANNTALITDQRMQVFRVGGLFFEYYSPPIVGTGGIHSIDKSVSGTYWLAYSRVASGEATISEWVPLTENFTNYDIVDGIFGNSVLWGIRYFSGRPHFCCDDSPDVFRLETDMSTWTQLPKPIALSPLVDSNCLVRDETEWYLWNGTEGGIYAVGESAS